MSLHGECEREFDAVRTSQQNNSLHESIIMSEGAACVDASSGGHQSSVNSEPLPCGTVGEEYESEKRAIYRHSLFPLLALLFERCEQATRAPDCVALASLKADIQLFVQHQQQRECKFVSDDPEVDSLMLRAIQTLRIHLLELEKVNELCKDFCSRYIACLRAKMQNEQLLHLDSFDAECSPGGMPLLSPSTATRWPAAGPPSDGRLPLSGNSEAARHSLDENIATHSTVDQANQEPLSGMSGAGCEPRRTAQDGCQSNAGTSLSPNIVNPAVLSSLASLDDIEDEDLRSSQNKRGMLPRHATQILKSWLYQHMVHPYPTDDEKRMLASQASLSILQVNNWFINARRRILQPIVDSVASAGVSQDTSKVKRIKTNTPPCVGGQQQRYWSAAGAAVSVGHESTEDPSSLSSTPSSTTFECDYGLAEDRAQAPQDQGFGCSDYQAIQSQTAGNFAHRSAGLHDDYGHYRLPLGAPTSFAGVNEMRETVGSSSDSVEFSSAANTCHDGGISDDPE